MRVTLRSVDRTHADGQELHPRITGQALTQQRRLQVGRSRR